jgi:hypothetical protein
MKEALMEYETILYKKEGGMALITFNRLERRAPQFKGK